MNFRFATMADSAMLAKLNYQLIQDEGHRNRMGLPELEQRMRDWLTGEYHGVLFEEKNTIIVYALYREQVDEIYLRHFFVSRSHRRQGKGRQAMEMLRQQIWPKDKRLTVETLAANEAGVAFWRSTGYKDYALKLEILPGGPPV